MKLSKEQQAVVDASSLLHHVLWTWRTSGQADYNKILEAQKAVDDAAYNLAVTTLDKVAPLNATGFRLASFVTGAIVLAPFTKQDTAHADIEKYIYDSLTSLGAAQEKDDWLELPDGTTYTLTFKPTKGEKHGATV